MFNGQINRYWTLNLLRVVAKKQDSCSNRSLNVSDLSFSQRSSSLEHLGNSSLDIFYISVNTMNVTLSGFIAVTHRAECLCCFFQRLKCESSNIWCLNLHITGSSPTPDWECFQTSPRSTRRPLTFFCRSTQYTPMYICTYEYTLK